MGNFYLTGDDTITLQQGEDSRTLADFPNGDVAVISKPNANSTRMVGKNANGIFAFNAEGNAIDMTLRVLTGSPDDKYLSALETFYKNNPTEFILLSAVFNKTLGDGKGNVNSKVYSCLGGNIMKQSDSAYNVSGDANQAISSYSIEFVDSNVNFQ